MLWSRCPLSRSFCAAKYKRSTSEVVLHKNCIPQPQPPVVGRDSRALYKHWNPPTRRKYNMAPKQATLGYVKPSQQTLGCALSLVLSSRCTARQIADTVDTGSSLVRRTVLKRPRRSNQNSPSRPKLRPRKRRRKRMKMKLQ